MLVSLKGVTAAYQRHKVYNKLTIKSEALGEKKGHKFLLTQLAEQPDSAQLRDWKFKFHYSVVSQIFHLEVLDLLLTGLSVSLSVDTMQGAASCREIKPIPFPLRKYQTEAMSSKLCFYSLLADSRNHCCITSAILEQFIKKKNCQ